MKQLIVAMSFIQTAVIMSLIDHQLSNLGLQVLVTIAIIMWQTASYKNN